MTDERCPVVDIDAHYYENPRAFAQYLDEPWKRRIETWTGQAFAPVAGNSETVDGRVGGRINHRVAGVAFPPSSRDAVAEAMSYLGVDVIVLLPGTMLTIGEITDKPRAVAMCNGFIDHMLHEVVAPERGIYTLVVAPTQSPPDAAALIDRVAGHHGVCGVAVMTDGPVLPLGDSYYDPIYAACCRHDLPLVLHSGYGGPEGRQSGYGLQTYLENHLAFVLNNQIQMTSIVMQGVPERFPDMKIVFEEAGVFWIPQVMFRLDSEYAMRRSQASWLKQPPSVYIKQFYFGTQPLEHVPDARFLDYVFQMIQGERCLMFATDWPHGDFDSPVVIQRLPFLDAQAKAGILGGNALGVFRFRGLADTWKSSSGGAHHDGARRREPR